MNLSPLVLPCLRIFLVHGNTRLLNKEITKVGQSDMNLSPLVLPCSRILLVQGAVDCLPCDGWALDFLPTQLVFLWVNRENISQWESNRQPFHLEMCTLFIITGKFRSSRTLVGPSVKVTLLVTHGLCHLQKLINPRNKLVSKLTCPKHGTIYPIHVQ